MDQRTMMSLGMLVVMVGLMYLLLIRPQKKKEKEIANMRAGIEAGDSVITIGGILGKVVKVRDDSFILAIGPEKTKVEVKKWAVSQIEKKKNEAKKLAKPKTLKKTDDDIVEAELEPIASVDETTTEE
ncbi:MAG: preprotein translocase subunit YajC [Eubacteriales bacterium]|nr:preprotein translocase subunit YajC [Eubacteriales bacterium]MDY3333095.1 preprotein translocase subunit YajC [Gallibacter sp.]